MKRHAAWMRRTVKRVKNPSAWVALAYLLGLLAALWAVQPVLPRAEAAEAAKEYPDLAGSVWLEERLDEGTGEYREAAYWRFLPRRGDMGQDAEQRPLKKAFRYYERGENKAKNKYYAHPNDWRQEGEKVYLYAGLKPDYECAFALDGTIEGVSTFRSRTDDRYIRIRLTRVGDPAVLQAVDEMHRAELPNTASSERTGKATPNEVRIANPNDFAVTATLLGVSDLFTEGQSWQVPPRGAASRFFPNGIYFAYFTFSHEPGARYQGRNVSLSNGGVEIKLDRGIGNYGLERVD